MQPGLEKVEKTNSFMNKKTFLKEYDTLVNTLRVITLVTLSKLLYLPTYLAHNSFHLHNNPDDKCSGILPWYYCSKHWHRTRGYFLHIRQCL